MANFGNQSRTGLTRRTTRRDRDRVQKPSLVLRIVKKTFPWMLALAIGGLAYGQLSALELARLFPFRYVRVQGEVANLDVVKFEESLKPAVQGGYFALNLAELEGAVRSFPWIDTVKLVRIWPDILEISVTEQAAVAKWGDRALLNAKGERFAPEGIEAFGHLPVIYGPSGMEFPLLEMLHTLNELLAGQGVRVAILDLSKRMSWVVKLDNGLEIRFGRQDPAKKLERFLGLIPKLGEGGFARLKRVDLRYPNGFAVVWKSEADIVSESKDETGSGL